MYYAQQTLYHKVTHKIVALYPGKNADTQFHWEGDSLIDEDGVVFRDDLNNYTNFVDFFGRPAVYTKEKSTNPYVDITLKKYLVSDEERRIMFEKEALEWYSSIIEKLDSKFFVRNPFADGSYCVTMRDYFVQKVCAIPFYTILSKEFKYKRPPYSFYRNYKTFLIEEDSIFEVEK